MIPPMNCPYRGLTAPPCYTCSHHITDTDQCDLATARFVGTTNTTWRAMSYEERLRDYEKRRNELLQLSKEALVDLLIHRPIY